jgi:hypothetical protein
MPTYYINGASFGISTAIYTDPEFTTCAPDGFYSFEGTVRELSGCVLQPIGICDECILPCGELLNVSRLDGYYVLPLSVGSDLGAIGVRFTTGGIPKGIRVTYDGTVYNKLSDSVFGYHGTTTVDGFTYLGTSTNACVDNGMGGVPLLINSPYSLLRNVWSPSLQSFVISGTSESVTVVAGDINVEPAWNSTAVMVIPKTSITPTSLLVEVSAPCSGSAAWSIQALCPVVLTSFASTAAAVSPAAACASGSSETYYNYPISGTAGNPAVNDFVFLDENGEFPLDFPAWYKFGTSAFQTNDFGVITSIVSC